MTMQNVDEYIRFVLRKHGSLMRPAIARYIREEFDRDVHTSILEARLENLKRKKIIKSFTHAMVKGNYYEKI